MAERAEGRTQYFKVVQRLELATGQTHDLWRAAKYDSANATPAGGFWLDARTFVLQPAGVPRQAPSDPTTTDVQAARQVALAGMKNGN